MWSNDSVMIDHYCSSWTCSIYSRDKFLVDVAVVVVVKGSLDVGCIGPGVRCFAVVVVADDEDGDDGDS